MDIAEMKPTAKKAAAKTASKGNSGFALGVLILKQADATAEAELKTAETRKQTLGRLLKFTREDHLEFRKALQARLDEYKASAETLGLTLSAFQQSDPKANSVTVTVSLWKKMSEAIEAGYRPEMDQPWAYISAQATAALMSKASAHVGTAEAPQRAAPVVKQKRGRPAADNVAKAIKLLTGMPAQDLETIGKWIASKLGKPIPFEAIKK